MRMRINTEHVLFSFVGEGTWFVSLMAFFSSTSVLSCSQQAEYGFFVLCFREVLCVQVAKNRTGCGVEGLRGSNDALGLLEYDANDPRSLDLLVRRRIYFSWKVVDLQQSLSYVSFGCLELDQ